MTTAIQTLIEQRNELDAKIQETYKVERKQAIKTIQDLMGQYDLTAEDIARKSKGNANTGTKVAPKWKDPASDATWTGRGKRPKWFDPATAIQL